MRRQKTFRAFFLLVGLPLLSFVILSDKSISHNTHHRTGFSAPDKSGRGTWRLDNISLSRTLGSESLGCREYELSSSGEENMVPWILSNFPPNFKGTFVEMGANNGVNSNSIELERTGWTGLCIEPAPENFRLLSRNRPKCNNVQALVSDKPGQAVFREFGGGLCGHSGLLRSRTPESWQQLLKGHPDSEYVDHTLPVRVLSDILNEYHISAIHAFVLDVEGEELNILDKLNLDLFTVHTWVVESNKINRDSLDEIMERWGYVCAHKKINSFCKHDKVLPA